VDWNDVATLLHNGKELKEMDCDGASICDLQFKEMKMKLGVHLANRNGMVCANWS